MEGKRTSSSEGTPDAKKVKTEVENELLTTCRELGMSPPKTLGDDTYRELSDVMGEIFADGFGDYLKEEGGKRALIWLYGRGYLSGVSPADTANRRTTIHSILTSPPRMVRLNTVLDVTGDSIYDTSKENYDHWKAAAEDYGQVDGAECLFEQGSKPTIVLRIQLSGNCFVHAPVVMHCYLLQRARGDFQGAVDITKYVRHYFDDGMLTRLIVNDDGGDSSLILEALTDYAETTLTKSQSPCFIANTVKNFKEHGPGLVRQFVTDKSMDTYEKEQKGDVEIPQRDVVIPSFEQYESPEVEVRHAMVLVGIRATEDGTGYYFLLQNWWPRSQFIEVSEQFLIASQCKIEFVTAEIKKLHDFPICQLKIAEAHVPRGQDSEDRVSERC